MQIILIQYGVVFIANEKTLKNEARSFESNLVREVHCGLSQLGALTKTLNRQQMPMDRRRKKRSSRRTKVNSKFVKFFAIFSVAFALTTQSNAQEGPGTSGLVTVLDVAKVFEQYPAFKQKMDAIKAEADTLKQKITSDQEQIRQEAMKLQNFEVGSPDRNQMERDLEHRQTDLRTQARQSEQDLLNREAIIYYETYSLMQSVVSEIAKENGISLVLRYDSTPIDKTNRAEVIKGVNRTVVYHRQLDLTTMVSQRLNARSANAGGVMRK